MCDRPVRVVLKIACSSLSVSGDDRRKTRAGDEQDRDLARPHWPRTWNRLFWKELFWWLTTFRQPERKSATTVLFRATLTLRITQHELIFCERLRTELLRQCAQHEVIYARGWFSENRCTAHKRNNEIIRRLPNKFSLMIFIRLFQSNFWEFADRSIWLGTYSRL